MTLPLGQIEIGLIYRCYVGYNPFEDDPSLTTDEVLQTLIEYVEARWGATLMVEQAMRSPHFYRGYFSISDGSRLIRSGISIGMAMEIASSLRSSQ